MPKRVAPNEPTARANGRPGMGKVEKSKRQKSKVRKKGNREEKMRNAECGIEEVVSSQSSVVSRVFSGDPKGSAGELRNADFGLRNGEQGNIQKSKIQSPNREMVRITDHESRKSAMAKRTQRVANARPQRGYDACCRARRRACARTCRAVPARHKPSMPEAVPDAISGIHDAFLIIGCLLICWKRVLEFC